MRILFVRVRIGVQESGYSYRLYIPFTESSFERQALISVHSDFGRGLARAYASCGCDRETVGAVRDRKSIGEGKSCSVRLDLGGGSIIKKKKQIKIKRETKNN